MDVLFFPGSWRFWKKNNWNSNFFQNLQDPGKFPLKLKKMIFIDEEYLILLFYMKAHPKIPLWSKN